MGSLIILVMICCDK